MGKVSIAAVQRYNRKMYSSLSVRIPKEMAAAFKTRCAASGISQAQVIKEAIQGFLSKVDSPD